MNVLVIGSGGREHAITWKLRQCPSVKKVWCAPGNGGIARDAECVPLNLKSTGAAANLAAKLGADLTIVGPELPLVLGIADEFARRKLDLLGPCRDAAQLEGSKVFAKRFMERHGIPTASTYAVCDSSTAARLALDSVEWPAVIKADGLCAGKGVLVTASRQEASEFIERLVDSVEFGDAGKRLLLEHALQGDELSYIVLTDGKNFFPLAPTRDHKRAFDDDRGPNTGGMGAYSTDEILPPEIEKQIVDTVVLPTLDGLRADGIDYRGFLYFGLMLTSDGPKVLEYNCRLGDPETETILLRANFDFGEACRRAARGSLGIFHGQWTPRASACVVIASEGYPGNPITSRLIGGLEEAEGVAGSVVFHAGTREEKGRYYTTGGRVLVVSASGDTLPAATDKVYDAVRRIAIENSFYRRDIGRRFAAKSQIAAEAPKR
jgi:phosphoribosylamine---glycine ligase